MRLERLPIHFGEGMDRESGLMVAQPNRFEDLRNVFLQEGQLVFRSGFSAAGDGMFPEVHQLVAGQASRGEGLGIVVGYNRITQRVFIYRVTADLSGVALLGEWEHDLTGWGAATPRIIMTDINGLVFMAHDEPLVTRRAPTLYYDPGSGGTLLNVLRQTWAGTVGGESDAESAGVEIDAVRFRGVTRHSAYLVGWGYGAAEEIRPELVRISSPEDPTAFDVNAYFAAGDRGDPVLACGSAGVLYVWKRTETHVIEGTERRNFGIFPGDPKHGIVSSRAWMILEGVPITWSEEGPRAWEGQAPSTAVDLPLGLRTWEAVDLPPEGALADVFTHYIPGERVGLFIFGRRAYALTARVPGRWRWSYMPLGFDSYGAITLYSSTSITAPLGFPEYDDATPAGTFADIDVIHHNQDGDEVLEVWMLAVES